MRTVILIPEMHAGSELALNKLCKSKDLQIVGLISANQGKRHWIRYGIRRSGLLYATMIGIMAYLHIVGVLIASLLLWHRKRKWLTVKEIIKKYNIPLHATKDINGEETIKIIRKWKPDLVISLYFNQILKKEVIQIATKATLNMHPGILPKYRGLWADFWKLYTKEKTAGVTIHYINEKIDKGEIIAQIKYPIKREDTKFSLMLKSAQHGSRLLIETIKKFKTERKISPLKIKGKGRYYRLPTREQFEQFYTQGRQLFSPKRFWKTIQKHFIV